MRNLRRVSFSILPFLRQFLMMYIFSNGKEFYISISDFP